MVWKFYKYVTHSVASIPTTLHSFLSPSIDHFSLFFLFPFQIKTANQKDMEMVYDPPLSLTEEQQQHSSLSLVNSNKDDDDEDRRIQQVIESAALVWNTEPHYGFAPNGVGRGQRFPTSSGRPGLVWTRDRGSSLRPHTKPPEGYVCRRCKVPGHFIQHCPTNGDPNFDIKVLKKPTGIPKHMLQVDPNGSYTMSDGVLAVVRPDEAAFDKLVEGLTSSSSSPPKNLPPELHCPLCKQVFKDAVLTSKCCLDTFCDTCIRDHIISKFSCVCGATNVLADHLLPNITVRKTINRMLQSDSSNSYGNVTSCVTTEDRESGASKNESHAQPLQKPLDLKEATSNEKPKTLKVENLSPVTEPEEKKPTSQQVTLHSQQAVPDDSPTSDPEKTKQQNNGLPPAEGTEQHSENFQISPNEGYYPHPACSGYWGGMQTGINNYLAPPYGPVMQYMRYTPAPFGFTHGVAFPQYHNGHQGYLTSPMLPQKGPGFDVGKKQDESCKADPEKKYENDTCKQSRECSGDWAHSRGMNESVNVDPKAKRKRCPERQSRECAEPVHKHNQAGHDKIKVAAEMKNKSDLVTSSGHRRLSSQQYYECRRSTNTAAGNMGDSSGRERKHLKMENSFDTEEQRHFKRRPTRYEPHEANWEEDGRERRSLRESIRYQDRDRELDRDYKRQSQYRRCRR